MCVCVFVCVWGVVLTNVALHFCLRVTQITVKPNIVSVWMYCCRLDGCRCRSFGGKSCQKYTNCISNQRATHTIKGPALLFFVNTRQTP